MFVDGQNKNCTPFPIRLMVKGLRGGDAGSLRCCACGGPMKPEKKYLSHPGVTRRTESRAESRITNYSSYEAWCHRLWFVVCRGEAGSPRLFD